jgi:quinol monooxygenase YgiN
MGKNMTVTIEVRAKPGKAGELYQTLQALIPTMRIKGCLDCGVSQETMEGETFSLSGDWDAMSSFESYMQSGSGSALLGAIELLGKSTRIRVGSETKWEGIETLQRMRKGA